MPIDLGHGFKMLTRAEWGARPATRVTPMAPDGVTGKTVHYSTGEELGVKDTAQWVRNIQKFHMSAPPAGRGWWDIAYNFLFDMNGLVFEGRGLRSRGGHAGPGNDTMGICFLGDDDPGQDVPDVARDALALTGRYIDRELGRTLRWYGHRDWMTTTCPGGELYGLLGDMPRWKLLTVDGTPGTPPADVETYVVQRGDTLASIAAAFGLDDWTVLHRWNPQIANPNVITPGTRLRVAPTATDPAPVPPTPPADGDGWQDTLKRALPTVGIVTRGEAKAKRLLQAGLCARRLTPADTMDSEGRPDGNFGDGTRTAVMAFERERGLKVNGLVGDDVWVALLGPLDTVSKASADGWRVRLVQGMVAANGQPMGHSWDAKTKQYDGVWGAGLDGAVRAVQRDAKLNVDGVVGPATYRALLRT